VTTTTATRHPVPPSRLIGINVSRREARGIDVVRTLARSKKARALLNEAQLEGLDATVSMLARIEGELGRAVPRSRPEEDDL
jgi:hypothetical protein